MAGLRNLGNSSAHRGNAVLLYDRGSIISCAESGQDGALLAGVGWPKARFIPSEHGVLNALTGLTWHAGAISGEKTVAWNEALQVLSAYTRETNLPWRMSTINELESHVDASEPNPALPPTQTFPPVMEAYWSSTTSVFETDWAYVLYLAKGAVGVGYKKTEILLSGRCSHERFLSRHH